MRPIEPPVLVDNSDYLAHAQAAVQAAVRAMPHASVAFRPHPREDPGLLRREFPNVDVDSGATGRLWLSLESSVILQALISGSSVVMFTLHGERWLTDLHMLSGVRTAHSLDELNEAVLAALNEAEGNDEGINRYASAIGTEAASQVADMVESYVQPLPRSRT